MAEGAAEGEVASHFRSASDGPQFRVDTDEVYLKRTREGFLVIPRDPWELFFEGVEELSDDFMRAGRKQPEVKRR